MLKVIKEITEIKKEQINEAIALDLARIFLQCNFTFYEFKTIDEFLNAYLTQAPWNGRTVMQQFRFVYNSKIIKNFGDLSFTYLKESDQFYLVKDIHNSYDFWNKHYKEVVNVAEKYLNNIKSEPFSSFIQIGLNHPTLIKKWQKERIKRTVK